MRLGLPGPPELWTPYCRNGVDTCPFLEVEQEMPMPPGPNGRAAQDPTYTPPQPKGLAPALDRNIEALRQRRLRQERAASWEERVADAITRFTGSMLFVYLHVVVFGFWIVANLHWIPGIPGWDESFVVLAMVASVEAIFLSTFVLISQNRMAAAADKRADLDLQISLLTEHELTKVAMLLSDMARKMGVRTAVEGDVEEIKRDVAPDAVLDAIEKRATDRH
jgi:uncharacterized membrane protein